MKTPTREDPLLYQFSRNSSIPVSHFVIVSTKVIQASGSFYQVGQKSNFNSTDITCTVSTTYLYNSFTIKNGTTDFFFSNIGLIHKSSVLFTIKTLVSIVSTRCHLLFSHLWQKKNELKSFFWREYKEEWRIRSKKKIFLKIDDRKVTKIFSD